MATPTISNGYLHLRGRKGKYRKELSGLGFLAHIVASAVAPVATNLLNDIVGNLFKNV